MMGMIIVDCRGPHAPWFIKHVDWNGLSPADFVFPSFVFIMGMAVPLAISKNNPMKLKNIIRIFALFLIGFLLNLFDEKFNF
jgi:predicted acyltransferase